MVRGGVYFLLVVTVLKVWVGVKVFPSDGHSIRCRRGSGGILYAYHCMGGGEGIITPYMVCLSPRPWNG